MTIIYCETDPVSSRWTGAGRLLTAYEVDYNFYQHDQAIAALQTLTATATVSIGTITMPTPSTMLITMTDSTTRGPFNLPTATFTDRGTWAPATAYNVNDTFTASGTLYRVLYAHTSAGSFSSTANDGAGHNYYAAMVSSPGNALPTGGATGQYLKKSSSSDYMVTWGWPVPSGGSTYQVLTKNSGTDQDFGWQTISGANVSFAGSTASTLTATNVTAAIEQVETNLQTLAASVGGLSFALSGLSDVHFATGDPVTGSLLYYGGSKWAASAAPSTGNVPVWDGTEWAPTSLVDTIQFVIDGGGSTLTTGMKGYIEVPFACTITRATLLADESGSVVVNVYKCSYANFDAGATHPASGDKITASAPPTISSSTKAQDSTLTGWTTSISAGDILAFNVDSVSSIQRLTISLKVTR
jgi:hypothetical protein